MEMNKAIAILEELGLSNSKNKWIRLYPQVSMLLLANDSREFIYESTIYYFDTTNNQILISEGHKDTVLSGSEKKDDFEITNIYNIQYVDGFICSSIRGPYGSYYTR